MSKSDPFGFDMSVSSAKKKNPRGRRGMSGASETSTRVCDHEGCQEKGLYRAPKAPDVLDDFFWFCKDHVREYNAKWSFFDGKTEAEMNALETGGVLEASPELMAALRERLAFVEKAWIEKAEGLGVENAAELPGRLRDETAALSK